ncbi:MAG: hypothetical protein R6V85_07245 [Polyangia bacterium]
MNNYMKVSVAVFCLIFILFFSLVLLAAQARTLAWEFDNVDEDCTGDHDGSCNFETKSKYWKNRMDDYWSTSTYDGYILACETADSDEWFNGLDHNYDNLDDGDATSLWGHGGKVHDYWSNEDHWYFRLSSEHIDTDNDFKCFSNTGWFEVGDNDAEHSHFFSCHSAQWDLVWDNRPYEAISGRLHHFGGFHGEARTSYWTENTVEDFVDEAMPNGSSVSYAWIHNFQEWNGGTGNTDICPVAIVHGEDQADAQARTNYENYGESYYIDDPPANDFYTKYLFYCNCNPWNGGKLTCN